MRLYAVLGFAFVAFISFALGVVDAYGPPLNETLGWLQEQMNTKATNGGNGSCAGTGTLASPCTWQYQATRFSGCEVSWVFTQISYAQRGLESEVKDEITMPLWADFSPAPFATAGEGEIWNVVLMLKDDSSQLSRHTRTFKFGTLTSVQVETHTSAEIHFGIPGEDNKDMAERFAKAFSRAIQLCQSRKPKTPKPF